MSTTEKLRSYASEPLVTTTPNGARVVNTKLLMENDAVRQLYETMQKVFENQQALEIEKSFSQVLNSYRTKIETLQRSTASEEVARQAQQLQESLRNSPAHEQVEQLEQQLQDIFRKHEELSEQLRRSLSHLTTSK